MRPGGRQWPLNSLPVLTCSVLLASLLAVAYTQTAPGGASYEIRLVNGSAPNEGRIELRPTNNDTAWLAVCGAYWDIQDGSVACRQLGFPNATSVSRTARFGSGSGRIISTNLQCSGSETSLDACEVGAFSENDCQHSQDAGLVCSPAPNTTATTATTVPPTTPAPMVPVRLVGGSSPFQGRVEVYLNDAWGTICDDGWDTTDARVVCRQLGYKGVFAATTNARFGQGTGPIQMDDTRCYGSETSILDCVTRGIGIHNCRHTEDAGVICLPDSRLAGGSNNTEGRIEIKVNDVWGTVCSEGFNDLDADIACTQMGFGAALSYSVGNDRYGRGAGPVLIKNLVCNANVMLLYQCPSQSVVAGDAACTHDNDVGVVCSTSDFGLGLRLAGGNNIFEGRVEVSINNTWGTVCDDYWDMNDAEVVCRQLELGRAVGARKYASFGRGFGPIHMDDVECTGSEDSLLDCPYSNQTACSHSEDAGVVCAPDIRLVGGMNAYQGRVEMFVNNEWGTICDTDWTSNEARVACRQLQFGFGTTVTQSSIFGTGSGPILASGIGCGGFEASLVQCSGFGIQDNTTCDSGRAGVICSLPENNTIQLVGGANAYEGRVEIQLDGVWGTVCDNNWDKNDARVVCKQLGFGPGIEAATNASFGKGSGPIYVDNLACRGHESNIAQCPSNGVEVHNCTHENDAGIVCSAPIRLVDGKNPFEGRVEVLRNTVWGTVCDDSWDLNDCDVVCRELGFGPAVRAVPGGYFGSRSYGSIHMDDVACVGNEESLVDCPFVSTHDCTHSEDAGVVCSGQNFQCELPLLPPYTYMNLVKHTYETDEVIAIVCENGNNTVEWRCATDKQWSGPAIACPPREESGHPMTPIIVGVVAIFVALLLIALVLVFFFVIYRNQRRQDFNGPVTMSDILAHIDTIRNSANTNNTSDVKMDGHAKAATHNDVTTTANDITTTPTNVDSFDDHVVEPEPFYADVDSKTRSTGGYARLIE